MLNTRPLGKFQKCKRCDEYGYSGRHSCGTAYDVFPELEFKEETATTVYASDREGAAIKYAAGLGDMYDGDRVKVFVTEAFTENAPTHYRVSAYAVIEFEANEESTENA